MGERTVVQPVWIWQGEQNKPALRFKVGRKFNHYIIFNEVWGVAVRKLKADVEMRPINQPVADVIASYKEMHGRLGGTKAAWSALVDAEV